LSEYLSDKYIIDICCVFSHSLVLTNSGEVYASDLNKWGQIGMEEVVITNFKQYQLN
jgi:alpha-tubulin suppressor-like RCC1 family protein